MLLRGKGIRRVTPENEIEQLKLKAELLFGMMLHATEALVALSKTVHKIVVQPNLLLSQSDRGEIAKTLEENTKAIDELFAEVKKFAKIESQDG